MQGEGDVGPGGAEGCQFPRPHRPRPPWDGCHLPLSQATPCFPRGWGGDPASLMALGGLTWGPAALVKFIIHIFYRPNSSPRSPSSLCAGGI